MDLHSQIKFSLFHLTRLVIILAQKQWRRFVAALWGLCCHGISIEAIQNKDLHTSLAGYVLPISLGMKALLVSLSCWSCVLRHSLSRNQRDRLSFLPQTITKQYKPVFYNFNQQFINRFLTNEKIVLFNHWTNQHDRQAGIKLSLGAKPIRRQTTDAASHRSNYIKATASNVNSETNWFKASIGEVSHIWQSQIQSLKLLRARSNKLSDSKSKVLIRETLSILQNMTLFQLKNAKKNLRFWTNQDWEWS